MKNQLKIHAYVAFWVFLTAGIYTHKSSNYALDVFKEKMLYEAFGYILVASFIAGVYLLWGLLFKRMFRDIKIFFINKK
ncbi:hypothetical protein [Candidatus Thioglobus sp.]|uniref:hypothetical protein n=1 Tax=Candidatus Thioglobus sp. TaxID=2026721 RepID=UPI003D0E0538